jgi:Leucine-rich repeat (LRR) protein
MSSETSQTTWETMPPPVRVPNQQATLTATQATESAFAPVTARRLVRGKLTVAMFAAAILALSISGIVALISIGSGDKRTKSSRPTASKERDGTKRNENDKNKETDKEEPDDKKDESKPDAAPPLDGQLEPVADMLANEQLQAVITKLKERNPRFDGKPRHKLAKDGVVMELDLSGGKVTDITPVRALAGLRLFNCNNTQVADLSPLKGMPLTELNCNDTQVSDLSPLENMKLTILRCEKTGVSDLSPLKAMKLTELNCNDTQVSDLAPLKGMKLTLLKCRGTKVSDLSPFKAIHVKKLYCDFDRSRDGIILLSNKSLEQINGKGAFDIWNEVVAVLPADKQLEVVIARLKERNPRFDGKPTHKLIKDGVVMELDLSGGKLTDITPVRALAGLRLFNCNNTQVSDLLPLKGMSLTELNCDDTQVSDLSPLKGMKLTVLHCEKTPVSDLSPLKRMKLTRLECGGTQVSDLSPLEGMPLTELNCEHTQVSDLSPLRDMKLTILKCEKTRVSDLSPLKGMKLVRLECGGTQVSDLSPLKGMPLTELYCADTKVWNLSPLRDMKLTRLECGGTLVSSLWSLKGMPLTYLACRGAKVADLSPLKGMRRLSIFECDDLVAKRDAKILRSIKSLERINGKDAKQFWKEVDGK